jgi:ribose transport system permease protein
MAGGKGTIIGTIFGILIIGILNNILTLLGVDPFLVNAVKGVIVILAVLFQRKEVEQ